VRTFIRRPHGPDYQGWKHPLSPHWQSRDGGWNGLKIQGPHVGYGHWEGLVLDQYDGYEPAAIVSEYVQRRMRPDDLRRLRCCGWHLTSRGEAGAWVDTTVPVVVVAANKDEFAATVDQLLNGAAQVNKAVGNALMALKIRGKNQFYERSETEFYENLRALAAGGLASAICETWHKFIARTSVAVFDSGTDTVRRDPLIVAKARVGLLRTVYGPRIRNALRLTKQAA